METVCDSLSREIVAHLDAYIEWCGVCPSHELRVEERRFRDQKNGMFLRGNLLSWNMVVPPVNTTLALKSVRDRHVTLHVPLGKDSAGFFASGTWLEQHFSERQQFSVNNVEKGSCFPFAVHKATMC